MVGEKIDRRENLKTKWKKIIHSLPVGQVVETQKAEKDIIAFLGAQCCNKSRWEGNDILNILYNYVAVHSFLIASCK